MFLLLLCLASAITFEDKEEQCFILSEHYIHDKRKDIAMHTKNYKALTLPGLKNKLLEDGFNYCVEHIKDDEVIAMKKRTGHGVDQFFDILNINLGSYKSAEDIKVAADFTEKRKELGSTLLERSTAERRKTDI